MKKLYISPDLKWNVINAKEDILIGSGEDMDNLCLDLFDAEVIS